MILFLRLLGVINAAVWFGASVFATFLAGPAFFSTEMIAALQHKYYAGLAAQIFLGRYFLLHCVCGSIAIVHLLAEKVYLNRRLTRRTLALWFLAVTLALAGGLKLAPKLHQLHHEMYFGATPAAQAGAAKTFRAWHGLSQAANLLVVAGLLFYFWRVTHPRRTWDASEI